MEEKSEQIQWMRLIFGRANRTLSWLGPEASNEEATDAAWAFHTLSLFYDQRAPSTPASRNALYPLPEVSERIGGSQRYKLLSSYDLGLEGLADWYERTSIWRRLGELARGYFTKHSYEHLLRVLHDMCEEEYFLRAWIYQEIALSAKITLCRGHQTLDWIKFTKAIGTISFEEAEAFSLAHNFGQGVVQMSLLSNHYVPRKLEDDFFGVIVACSSANCTNPRDHVYAFLGLCNAEQGLNFSVDYDRSVGEVYRQSTLEALEGYRKSDSDPICHGNADYLFLLSASTEFHRNHGVPAWVPDYSNMRLTGLWVSVYRHRFQASRGQQFFVSILQEHNRVQLKVRGVIVDRVVAAKPIAAPEPTREEATYPQQYLMWLNAAHRFLTARILDIRKDQQGWRALCGDLFVDDGGFVRADANFQQKFRTLMKNLRAADESRQNIKIETLLARDEELRAFLNSCKRWASRGGGIGITFGGRIASLPEGAAIGDSICLVAGSNVPLVVRHVEAGSRKLVGWCYLDGAMYGEMWPVHSDGSPVEIGEEIVLA